MALAVYCCMMKKREPWFLLLFTSVLVVNTGYFLLSVSSELRGALMANRLAYLGAAFLPLSVLMIILKSSKVNYKRWLPGLLIGISAAMFLMAASQGYVDLYYKQVFFEIVNGTPVLNKIYGPLHSVYMLYLLGYTLATVFALFYAILKKKIETPSHAVILATAVFVNIGVWLLEQLVKIEFEILAVSYVITGMFLLGLNMSMLEQEKLRAQRKALEAAVPEPHNTAPEIPELDCQRFSEGLLLLTKTERTIYEMYTAGRTTKEIMADLNITENTLKFHNKNFYGKLGVSSRKQLLEIYWAIQKRRT